MKKESSSSEKKLTMTVLKDESIQLAVFWVLLTATLQAVFFKESLDVVAKTSSALFWMFVLPGFTVMYYWFRNFSFVERVVLGIMISAAVVGIFGYYLGLVGIHTRVNGMIIPLMGIAVGSALIAKNVER